MPAPFICQERDGNKGKREEKDIGADADIEQQAAVKKAVEDVMEGGTGSKADVQEKQNGSEEQADQHEQCQWKKDELVIYRDIRCNGSFHQYDFSGKQGKDIQLCCGKIGLSYYLKPEGEMVPLLRNHPPEIKAAWQIMNR